MNIQHRTGNPIIIHHFTLFLMEILFNLRALTDSVVYSLVGIVILVLAFVAIEKITPENIYKKIVEQGNVALAIVIAAFTMAMAIIISSAIHG